MKQRMIVAAVLAALVVGVTPMAVGSTPGQGRLAPAGIASAHRLWFADFGSSVDGMAVDPGTRNAFVRASATPGGADLMMGAAWQFYEPDRISGPFGYPVAADGAIFVFKEGKLRRLAPATGVETGSWTVPGLTVDLALAAVDDDVVWVVRSTEPQSQEQLYRFDPDTGTTTTSGPTDVRYSGPIGGGGQLVGYAPTPGRLVSITGTTPGAYVDTGIAGIAGIDVAPDGSLVTVLDAEDDEAVEYSMPGFVPTGTVYDVAGRPRVAASTTAAGGALAVVSERTGTDRYVLRVYARGNPDAVVDVSLPPLGRVPEAGDLVFSADGKQLHFLVRDQSGTNAIARFVTADLATTVFETADPIVVGSKGGAQTHLVTTLGPGTKVTVGGVPVETSVSVESSDVFGGQKDRITFTVPAMEPGTKLIWLTNALGHSISGGPVNVMDLGPFVNAPWFVQKQMSDINGKKATPAQVDAGILQLLADLDAGKYIARLETERGQMTQRAALIRLYRAVFLRTPDTAGLTYWLDRMEGGTRLVQVAATFAGSNEFKTRYGSLTNAQFVERIYQNVLGRGADPSGRVYWIKKLATGTSRGVLVAQFAQSNEYVNRMQFDVRIIELRLAMLGRTPTEMELASLRIKPLEDVAWMYLNDPNYKTAG